LEKIHPNNETTTTKLGITSWTAHHTSQIPPYEQALEKKHPETELHDIQVCQQPQRAHDGIH
jgi:hypothetical protein